MASRSTQLKPRPTPALWRSVAFPQPPLERSTLDALEKGDLVHEAVAQVAAHRPLKQLARPFERWP